MELLVALLDAEQDLHRIGFGRRRNLDGLEAALQRAVLLDRLAELRRRGCADALNLAARQSGLQDVGGVERTFRRTGAHQRVQLVDEDDGILRLHQFLHDGLEPLFKLAAILRAGHDQRQIEREDALVRQERRHFAVGDALRQAFDDGGLADAGLADQHRIVLGAAAQNLDHALEFAVASNQRIELVVHGRLRQVARELGQQGRLAIALRGLRLLLRGARQFLANGRQAQSALVQNLGGKAFLFAQQSQQQMLGANVLVRKALGFFRGVGQHALALVAQGQVHGGRYLLPDRGVGLDLLANGFHRSMRPQEPIGQRLVFAQKTQQQVLRLDVRRTKLAGFVTCEEDDASGLFRVPFEHWTSPKALREDFPILISAPSSFLLLPFP